MKFIEVVNNLFFGCVDASFYEENHIELEKTNYTLLKRSVTFSTGMCLFLFLITLPNNSLVNQLKYFYLFFTFFYCILSFLTLTYVNKHRRYIRLFYYIFAISIFALSIIVGTVITPELPAITFFVFLMIIPILHVAKPIYSVILSIVAAIAFCITTFFVKGSNSFLTNTDILNALCCMIVSIGFDITIINMQLENIQAKSFFRRQSTTDELTRMPNRRGFDLYIEKLFYRSIATKKDFLVMILDIDDFKAYNDTYGHIQGDLCLTKVSEALKKVAFSKKYFLARYGGEEFVVVAQITKPNIIEKEMTDFITAVQNLNIPHSGCGRCSITISAGYATLFETQAESHLQLLDYADSALYKAKTNGKNQIYHWKNN